MALRVSLREEEGRATSAAEHRPLLGKDGATAVTPNVKQRGCPGGKKSAGNDAGGFHSRAASKASLSVAPADAAMLFVCCLRARPKKARV